MRFCNQPKLSFALMAYGSHGQQFKKGRLETAKSLSKTVSTALMARVRLQELDPRSQVNIVDILRIDNIAILFLDVVEGQMTVAGKQL